MELALYAVPPAVGVVSAPILARALGADGRGEYAIILAVLSFAVTFGALGQSELHAHELRVGHSDRRRRLRIAAVGSTVAAIAAWLILVGWFSIDPALAFAGAVFVPLLSIAAIWRTEHISLANLLLVSSSGAVSSLLRLAAVAILFSLSALGVLEAVLATQLAAVVVAFALWAGLRGSASLGATGPHKRGRTEVQSALQILGFAALTAVLLRANILVLGAVSPLAEVGVLSAVVSLSEAALALSAAFKNRLQSVLYASGSGKRVLREYAILHAVAIPGLVTGFLFSDVITLMLFGEEFAGAGDVLRMMIVAAYFQMLMDCGNGMLTVLGARSAMVSASAAGAGAVLISLFLLAPVSGALGAALATIIAYALAAGLSNFAVYKLLRSRGD